MQRKKIKEKNLQTRIKNIFIRLLPRPKKEPEIIPEPTTLKENQKKKIHL
jgi:hypothetical protein